MNPADVYFIGGIGLLLLFVNIIGCLVYQYCSKFRENKLDQYGKVAITDYETDTNSAVEIHVVNRPQVYSLSIGGKISIIIMVLAVCILIVGLFDNYLIKYIADIDGQDKIPDINSNTINDYVLPHTKVIINVNNAVKFGGKFIVNEMNNLYEYNFEIAQNSPYGSSHFIDHSQIFGKWKGFQVYPLGDGIQIDFINSNNKVENVQFTPDKKLEINDHIKLESIFGDLLFAHFVELSIKTGSLGYIGTKSSPILSLHSFAEWIYEYVNKNDNIDNSGWNVDFLDEFHKTNRVRIASKKAGFQIETIEELTKYLSNTGTQRSLMDWDETPAPTPPITCRECKCGNKCYGLCGAECICWVWLCDNCDCNRYCRDHDYFCSCLGMTNWYCLSAGFDYVGGGIYNCDGSWGSPEHHRYSCTTDCKDDCNDDCETCVSGCYCDTRSWGY